MKRCKRLLAAVLLCALALCLLTACGVESDFKDSFQGFTKGVYYFEGTDEDGDTHRISSDGTALAMYSADSNGSSYYYYWTKETDTKGNLDFYSKIFTPDTSQKLATGTDAKTGYDTVLISFSDSYGAYDVTYSFDGSKLKTITLKSGRTITTLNVVKHSPTPDSALIAKAKAADEERNKFTAIVTAL